MCGICGVASEWLSQGDIKKYMELHHLSVLRGWEGSGVIFVDEGKKHRTRTLRSMGNGTQLILSRKFGEMVRDQRKQCLIGHTRYPTRGKKILDNVHPHTFGHICGVHNGTFKQVNGKWLYGSDRSDSSAIYEDIATRGIDEAIKNAEGAYVLVWIDAKEGTLNFLRNHERPLWFARNKSDTTMYWASDKDYLTTVLEPDDFEFTELVPNQHVRYELPFVKEVLPSKVEKKEPDEPRWKVEQREWQERMKNNNNPWNHWGREGTSYGSRTERQRMEDTGRRVHGGSVIEIDSRGRAQARGINRHFQTNLNHANASQFNGNSTLTSISSQRMPPPIIGRIAKDAATEREPDHIQTAKGYWCLPSRVKGYIEKGCVFCSQPIDMADVKNGDIVWGSFCEPICSGCFTSPDMHASIVVQYPNLLERKTV